MKKMRMKSGVSGHISKKLDRITPFYVMELLEEARRMEAAGEDIVHMEIGEPDFSTPESIKEAALQAIRDNRTFYTESLGLPKLRERIAEYYCQDQGLRVPPERIVITSGTSGAFSLLASVLLGRNRSLVMSDPGYPCYRNFGLLAGADLVPIPVDERSGFRILPAMIEKLKKRPHLVMIANPSNPTGTIYDAGSLRALLDSVRAREGILLIDEIYRGLTYDGEFRSGVSISDDVIVVDGFSKVYAMTGWRLGWMVVPEELVRAVQKVSQNVYISAPTVSQHAALAAFDARDEVERMKDRYRERRAYLMNQLEGLGFQLPASPEGAFYIYAGIQRWNLDSMLFVKRALSEAKVALTPGYDFGAYRAGEFVRFSYATDKSRLEEGCRRLREWLRVL
jgi:aspartate/methionine/tyrosine aminotransferase